MKILFVRHGESQDDIEDRYGGWADFELTEKGKGQITNSLKSIKQLDVEFEIVLTSPLKRAITSAKIIGEDLSLPVEIFEYVKERNTYGVLSGMVKSEAKEKYPDQVELLGKDEYVDGSERQGDLIARARQALFLVEQRKESNLIIVTHGNFLKGMSVILDKKLVKKEDGGFVLMNLAGGKLSVLVSGGIEYE